MNKFKAMVLAAGLGLLAPLSGQTHFNPDGLAMRCLQN